MALVLVANNSNELSQEHLHTTHVSHATSGQASSATARPTPHISLQILQDVTLPIPHDSLVYPSSHISHNTERTMSCSNSLVFTNKCFISLPTDNGL